MSNPDPSRYEVLPNGQLQSKFYCMNCGCECHCSDSLIPKDPDINCNTCNCEGTDKLYTYSNN